MSHANASWICRCRIMHISVVGKQSYNNAARPPNWMSWHWLSHTVRAKKSSCSQDRLLYLLSIQVYCVTLVAEPLECVGVMDIWMFIFILLSALDRFLPNCCYCFGHLAVPLGVVCLHLRLHNAFRSLNSLPGIVVWLGWVNNYIIVTTYRKVYIDRVLVGLSEAYLQQHKEHHLVVIVFGLTLLLSSYRLYTRMKTGLPAVW